MAVCKFYLAGKCRYGNDCHNQHPPLEGGGFGNNSWNRGVTDTKPLSLPFTAAHIASDLTATADKPIWPLSSYAPAKHEPLLLAGLDESPEELRVKAVTALRAGNLNEYLAYESNKIATADQVYANARTNPQQAYDQAVKQSQLPGLIAEATSQLNPKSVFGGGNASSAFPSTSSAFGNLTSTTTSSAFGTNATSGQPTFGQSAFGQPAFGQPAFGQTSIPAIASSSTFGKPQNASAPVSAFAQLQQPATAFGQPAPTSAFGQPSVFGQAAQTTSPSIVKPSSRAFSAFSGAGPSAFGTTPSSTGGGGFSVFAGQPSAFGLGGSNISTTTSAFGQPSFGEPLPKNESTATPSAFGTPAQASASVFGTPSGFGALAQQQQTPIQSTFAATTPLAFNNTTKVTSAFGQSAFSNISNGPTPTTSAFGSSSAFGTSSNFGGQSANVSAFVPAAPSKSMEMKSESAPPVPLDFASVKGTYKPGSNPYDDALPQNYMEQLPKEVQEAFKSSKFEWGKVPDWPPPVNVR